MTLEVSTNPAPAYIDPAETMVLAYVRRSGETNYRKMVGSADDPASAEFMAAISGMSITAYTAVIRSAAQISQEALDLVNSHLRPSIRELLTGMYASGIMPPGDRPGWEAGIAWSAAVQAEAQRAVLAGENPTWPTIPAAAQALAAKYPPA